MESSVRYQDGGTTFVGRLARPHGDVAPAPGVVVFPTWRGVDGFARTQAARLAELGYVALAADVYGEGRVAATDEEAATRMQELATDRAWLRRRARVALDALCAADGVDPDRVAALGFCFGGMGALELARSGAPVRAVATFHGFLDTPDPRDAARIQAAVQVHHGSLDPLVPPEQITAFGAEMDGAGVDWHVVLHGGALHGFMNPAAAFPEHGIAYDAVAAARAWTMVRAFLAERMG